MATRIVVELCLFMNRKVSGIVLLDMGYQVTTPPTCAWVEEEQQRITNLGYKNWLQQFFNTKFGSTTPHDLREAVMKKAQNIADTIGTALYLNTKVYDYYALEKALRLLHPIPRGISLKFKAQPPFVNILYLALLVYTEVQFLRRSSSLFVKVLIPFFSSPPSSLPHTHGKYASHLREVRHPIYSASRSRFPNDREWIHTSFGVVEMAVMLCNNNTMFLLFSSSSNSERILRE